MVKVLFVSPVANFKGGAEQVLLDMMKNPFVQCVLALPGNGALEAAATELDIPVTHYAPGAILNMHRPLTVSAALGAIPDLFRSARQLRDAARHHQITILHSNGLKAHVVTMLACLGTRFKSVAHFHDIPYSPTERLGWRLINRLVDRMVVVSRPCWPGRFLPQNLRIVPNGLLGRSFVARAEPGGKFQVGFVGRFHPHKGLLPLMDWIAGARAKSLAFQLRLRGAEDPDYLPYWERVQKRIQDLGLHEVVSIDGWRPAESVLDGLDVLVVPSDHPDPLPRVVLEAGNAALPVIASRSGGIPEMIIEGETGFIVETESQFVASLTKLIKNPELRSRMGRQANEHVTRTFSLDLFHRNLSKVYSELVH
jgi:glycosyltransferase involved in cell wall biosynthesis